MGNLMDTSNQRH